MNKKLHYFAFAFAWRSYGQSMTASVYVGYDDKLVTVPRINAAKASANASQDAVLIGLGYMGRMTPEIAKGGNAQ